MRQRLVIVKKPMTKEQKRRFIRDLSRNVIDGALRQVKNMPENWDGIELRRYLADLFDEANFGTSMRGRREARYREWRLSKEFRP